MTKTILCVDDSPSIRQMVNLSLTGAGYAVVQAVDGVDGLRMAATAQASLIITDLNMPNMNGLQFIREIRKMPAYAGVPILFLTTESDAALKQEAKAAGATGWITKPFQQEQLVAVVRKVIGA